jgi:tripartite-type tricarboxylate transporter receptor subunit TctC
MRVESFRFKPFLYALAFTACGLAGSNAAAQSYPSKTVRIIIPQNPGGTTDVLGRVISAKLTAKWGVSVIIDYRAGAGGNIGMDLVAKSPGDGYTLLLGYVGTQSVNGAVYAHLPYDPDKDFVSVASLATIPFMTVVNKDVPVKTMKELVALAKTKPLNYATSGNGSLNQLMGEMLNNTAHIKITHVPYKGIAQAITDTIAGRIEVLPTAVPSAFTQVKAGALRPLSVTSAKRVAALPDVPTVAEAGFPELTFDSWFGLFAPASTPMDIVQKINADVNEALRGSDVVEKFESVGGEPFPQSQQQFAAQVKADTAKWGKVARDAHVTVD